MCPAGEARVTATQSQPGMSARRAVAGVMRGSPNKKVWEVTDLKPNGADSSQGRTGR